MKITGSNEKHFPVILSVETDWNISNFSIQIGIVKITGSNEKHGSGYIPKATVFDLIASYWKLFHHTIEIVVSFGCNSFSTSGSMKVC